MAFIRRHPVRNAALATFPAIGGTLYAVAQVWQSFTEQKIPDWYSTKLGVLRMHFSDSQLELWALLVAGAYFGVLYLLFRPHETPIYTKQDLTIEIVPRWASPVKVNIINESDDYDAHIRAARLYGVLPDGKIAKIGDDVRAIKGLGCQALGTLDRSRSMTICFVDNPQFKKYDEIYAEVETENRRVFTSPRIEAPRPQQGALNIPDFKIQCGPEVENCSSLNRWGDGRILRWFMVLVETATNSQIEDVTATLERIEKDGKTKWKGPPQKLPFSPAGESGEFSKAIRPKARNYFSVIFIDQTLFKEPNDFGVIGIGSPNIGWPHVPRLSAIFQDEGDYILTVLVTGKDVQSEQIQLQFYRPKHPASEASMFLITPPSPDQNTGEPPLLEA